MNMNLKKQSEELKIHQAYRVNAKSEWYDERINSLINKLQLNRNIVTRSKGSADELYDNFIKFIIKKLNNKHYFNARLINTIENAITEYPSLNILDILTDELLTLRSYLTADITSDDSNPYFSLSQIIAITRNDYSEFRGASLFENNIITKINDASSSLDTLTKNIKDNLIVKAKDYLSNYNLALEDTPKLKVFLESQDSIWTSTYNNELKNSTPIGLSDLIRDKLSKIGADAIDYSEIISDSFIDKLFNELMPNIQGKVLKIVKDDIDSKTFITSFKQEQIFDQDKSIRDDLGPATFIKDLDVVLKKFNLTKDDIRFGNFKIVNENKESLKISDAIGFIETPLELKLDGEWHEINYYSNKRIVISVESMKRLFDYMSEKGILTNKKTIIASELPAILNRNSMNLKTLFENYDSATFDNITLQQLKQLFDFSSEILTQDELNKLFAGLPNNDQILLNDLDFKFKITLHWDNQKPLWDSIKVSIDKFEISDKTNNDINSKYKTINVKTSIFKSQNNTEISSLPVILRDKLKMIQYKILLPKISFIFKDSLKDYDFLLNREPDSWITNLVTTWGVNGLKNFVEKELNTATNSGRFVFKFWHEEADALGTDSYLWYFDVEDKLLGQTYSVSEINIPIFDAIQVIKLKELDLKKYFRLNFEEIKKLSNQQNITLENALKLFITKENQGKIIEDNLVLNLPSGEQVIPLIKYVKRIENGIEVSKIELTYEYVYQNFNESTSNTNKRTYTFEIDATAKPVTIDHLNDGKKELDTKADEAYQDLKQKFPYNSNINKNIFNKIISDFYSKAKIDLENEVLMEEDFNARLEKAKEDIDRLKEKTMKDLDIGFDYLTILNRIFNGKIPADILKWVEENPGKIIQMINLDLDDETIRELLKNSWIRDLFKETGILDMDVIKKALQTMEHIKTNYGYAYFGAGIGLGVAGLLSGFASVATLKASKRSKKLSNSNSTIKSSKLIISTTTVLSLLLLLGSTCLMLWFFITKGGSF